MGGFFEYAPGRHEKGRFRNTVTMRNRNGSGVAALLFLALYGMINSMGKSVLSTSRHTMQSDKIAAPVTIAVVADLHNTRYGVRQSALLSCVRAGAPDAVAFVGDAFHARENERHTHDALTALAAEYPCYYVIGNHERNSGECERIKSAVRAHGVTVLDGACVEAEIGGQLVQFCGLDDFSSKQTGRMQSELIDVSARVQPALLSVLLVHRPERFSEYLPCGFDVILCGHAHGGQWRIPGAKNGVYSPGQGWFPQYAGGRYDFGEQTMFVSCGLSGKPVWLARFGNPPEVMFVTVSPA